MQALRGSTNCLTFIHNFKVSGVKMIYEDRRQKFKSKVMLG